MERRPTSILTTLAVSVLALTLIAPWVLGQDPDPITEIRRQAEQGDADAQFNLGYRYATGIGVPRDRAEAARWFRLAADQGHVQAQNFLERILPEGGRVPEDDAEAARGRQAADQLSLLVKTGTAQEGTSQQLMAASRLQCEFNDVVIGKWDENGKLSTEVTIQELNLLFSNIQDESATVGGKPRRKRCARAKARGDPQHDRNNSHSSSPNDSLRHDRKRPFLGSSFQAFALATPTSFN